MREAIRILVSEGLVTLIPRRGSVVATPTAEELHGLFLALGGLESVCAPIACANFTSNEIDCIERQHKLMLASFSRGDMTNYYKANETIHKSIANGTRNKFLIDFHQLLSVRILRVRFFVDLPKSAWSRAQREHDQMLRYIKNREGRQLAALLLDHMIGSWKDYELTFGRSKATAGFISTLSTQ
jgi:DNA-binding GntR family transcriptional regulator